MARCLQSLVLTSDGIISPVFSSIEEYLGRNTSAYYAALAQVGQTQWQPERSARPWVQFCLTAHFRQLRTLLRRVRDTEALWDRCEQLVSRYSLPPRCVGALCDAAVGWRVRRSLYMKVVEASSGDPITAATATRDLRAIASAGLIQPVGEKRGRHYEPTQVLRGVWDSIRSQRPSHVEENPYAGLQPTLPGL